MSPIAVSTDSPSPSTTHPKDHPKDSAIPLRVAHSPKAFSSAAYATTSLPAGSLFAKITTATPAPKAYTSVQTGRTSHIELNSDLVFCNHSCAPSLEFDMGRMEVRVSRTRDLKEGDACTFFYPSTEWEMSQPFRCECEASACCGWIGGAGGMDGRVLGGYWLNEHVVEMLRERN